MVAMANRSIVELRLFPFQFVLEIQVFLLILGSVIIGVAISSIIYLWKMFSLHVKYRDLEAQAHIMANEIILLRIELKESVNK